MAEELKMDRNLALEAVRVTEAAALSASRLMGRGDEKAADQAAVDAMRQALNSLSIEGTVVIGEGERDEAPMLFIGEKVGTGQGPKIDIALDPLEGTTITAKGAANALAVLAMADHGGFLNAPDVYMDKIAVGGGLPDGVVDLDAEPAENLANLARAKKLDVADLVVCILDRPRHAELIAKVRAAGARIMLIGDGDVSGVMATSDPETGIDIYMGSGGAPEGVLAAAALRCIGGQMQGRLLFRNDDERGRAHRLGVTDLNRKYTMLDMAHGDVMFAATGVTNGSMLKGVRRFHGGAFTHSVVMRSKTGTVRYVEAKHDFHAQAALRAARPLDARSTAAGRRMDGTASPIAAPPFLGVERSVCGRRWRVRGARRQYGAADRGAARAAGDRRAAAGAARRRPRRGAALSRAAPARAAPGPGASARHGAGRRPPRSRDPRRRDDRRLRRLRRRRRDLGGAAAAVFRGGRRPRLGLCARPHPRGLRPERAGAAAPAARRARRSRSRSIAARPRTSRSPRRRRPGST